MIDNVIKFKEYMQENKAEAYPIEEHILSGEIEEYLRDLYIKMLCVILQNGKNTEEQRMFIKRIMSAAKTQNNIQDYMRQAIEADIDFIGEFIKQMKENSQLKYAFLTDSLIIEYMEQSEDNCEFIASLAETVGMNVKDISYITLLAKSILQQDSDIYKSAEEIRPKNIIPEFAMCYVKKFVSGYLYNTGDEIYFYSYEYTNMNLLDLRKTFQEEGYKIFQYKKIIFENITFEDMSNKGSNDCICFEGNEIVEFKNCNFLGNSTNLILISGNSFSFTDCLFKRNYGYNKNIFDVRTIKNLIIKNCVFEDISRYISNDSGGLIVERGTGNYVSMEVYIENSKFYRCSMEVSGYREIAILLVHSRSGSVSAYLKNNIFNGCKSNGMFYGVDVKQNENNQQIGSNMAWS